MQFVAAAAHNIISLEVKLRKTTLTTPKKPRSDARRPDGQELLLDEPLHAQGLNPGWTTLGVQYKYILGQSGHSVFDPLGIRIVGCNMRESLTMRPTHCAVSAAVLGLPVCVRSEGEMAPA